jgi:glycosyl transferase family 25
MDILLINLDASRDRLAFQQQQFARLGFCFKRLCAVSVNEITEDEYERLAYSWERPLRRTELACFMSHRLAWEEVVRLERPCLILEDDVLISNKIAGILEALQQIRDMDHVTLENRCRKKLVSKTAIRSLPYESLLYRLYLDRTGAAAYVLWPTGAEKLLVSFHEKGPAIADAFISLNSGLVSGQVEPAPVIQLDMCSCYRIAGSLVTESTISNSTIKRPKAATWMDYFVFRLRRLRANFYIARVHLSKLFHGTRRFITLRKEDFEVPGL